MIGIDYVAQPALRTTLDAIGSIAHDGEIEGMDVAAAYITASGVHDFLKRLTGISGANWKDIKKRWITSFDYCRTEPVALDALLSLPSSSIRIYDAHFCLAHRGAPKIPFHPKAFFFRSPQRDYVLVGSGNLSRSGLSKGVEAGLVLRADRNGLGGVSASELLPLRQWFSAEWKNATVLDGPLLASYSKVFESAGNLKNPTPTEDDLASDETSTSALSSKDLQKLRVCGNLWIEAGNITKNLGPHRPGNQLMMKRLSRVFFGFTPDPRPKNSFIGSVGLQYQDGVIAPYSLTHSDNKMDKLILPAPGSDGPPEYDNRYLIFRQKAPRVFTISLGTKGELAGWQKSSKAIDGAFKMSSGREWGVF